MFIQNKAPPDRKSPSEIIQTQNKINNRSYPVTFRKIFQTKSHRNSQFSWLKLIAITAIVLLATPGSSALLATPGKFRSACHPGWFRSACHPGWFRSACHPGWFRSACHPWWFRSVCHPGWFRSACHLRVLHKGLQHPFDWLLPAPSALFHAHQRHHRPGRGRRPHHRERNGALFTVGIIRILGWRRAIGRLINMSSRSASAENPAPSRCRPCCQDSDRP